MHIASQQFGIIGGVGDMTDGAGGFPHRIISMAFPERIIIAIMAGEAELLTVGNEQSLIVRTVGHVAGQTALFGQGGMDVFLLKILPFMTLITHFTACCFQQVRTVAPMGVMTVIAFIVFYRAVDKFTVESKILFLVAFKAELLPLTNQHHLREAPMPQMTCIAFPFPDHGMNTALTGIPVYEILVAVAAFLSFKFSGCTGMVHEGNRD